MDAIRMMGIVKCFGPVRANDGIDLIVKQQEIHCLLGENGTGKSTLMNILFGLYHPDAGEIYINEYYFRKRVRRIFIKQKRKPQKSRRTGRALRFPASIG